MKLIRRGQLQAYTTYKCLSFCSRCLHRAEARFKRLERNEEDRDIQDKGLIIFMKIGKATGSRNYQGSFP